jgi:hypothetical protein
MASHNMFPPGDKLGANPITVNGRTFTCAPNSLITVQNQGDLFALEANGWQRVSRNGAGPTTARPSANLFRGQEWLDTTLGLTVIYDGVAWRSTVTGAVA